jgi:hypothetical protein
MRHVYTRPSSADRTPGQKACRKWLDDNPRDFLGALSRREEALLASRAKKAGEDPEEAGKPDGGWERAGDVLRKWQEEWDVGRSANSGRGS